MANSGSENAPPGLPLPQIQDDQWRSPERQQLKNTSNELHKFVLQGIEKSNWVKMSINIKKLQETIFEPIEKRIITHWNWRENRQQQNGGQNWNTFQEKEKFSLLLMKWIALFLGLKQPMYIVSITTGTNTLYLHNGPSKMEYEKAIFF